MRELPAGDYDKAAEVLYRAASLDPSEPASPLLLARRLLGEGAVRTVDVQTLPGHAALVRVGANWRIYLKRGAPPDRARFAVLHEIGHWLLGTGASEDDCNRMAAALAAPRRAFFDAMSAHGRRFSRLARSFRTTESLVALRYGELTGAPLALVTPRKVRTRGDGFAWPSEPELRALASLPRVPGLRKARLRDDPMRVVVRATG